MNKTYIISTTIAATILLVLKITDLNNKELETITILELIFYVFIIGLMSFSFLKLKREMKN
ncbi:MAG: hypothetical protein P8H13_02505 [Polaribacter sp.]|nr:hypothetical protein [Polaribacter sp.]MDG1810793.1 hypothetical protein [Polaribacter sp.]MDG1993570.1 hypothetical protein [Polaribacter sp.]